MTVEIDLNDLPPSVSQTIQDEVNDGDHPDWPECEACHRLIPVEPGKRGRKPKWHPECRPSAKAKPKAATTRRKATKASAPNYAEGITGLFQMASFGLMVAAGNHSKELLADSKAVAEHGPGIANALDALAQEKPEVANVLDKILAVGPYGVLLGAIAPLALQIGRNHGAPIPGIPSADEYLATA